VTDRRTHRADADALAATHTPLLTGHGLDPDQARHVARMLGGTLAFVTGNHTHARPALARRTRDTLDRSSVQHDDGLVEELQDKGQGGGVTHQVLGWDRAEPPPEEEALDTHHHGQGGHGHSQIVRASAACGT